jgi:transcriptional repressor NrdR
LRCPQCQHPDDRVIDSRTTREGRAIRRRRECLACGFRFTTYENAENPALLVVKRDGRREPFSREKLFTGIAKACEKRPIAAARIHEVVDRIESESVPRVEVESREIGERVMSELARLDEVAYVRFASVYRQFQDVNEFIEEIRDLMK